MRASTSGLVAAIATGALVLGGVSARADDEGAGAGTTQATATETTATQPTESTPTESTPTESTPTETTPTETTPPPTTKPPAPKYTWRTVTIGHSRKGRPIRATYKGWSDAKRVVLVLGQMHGDEPAGPKVVRRMISHERVAKGYAVWFVPTMNPDGAAKKRRTNARGVDLNRNWPTSGWSSKGKGSRTWGGPRRQSEPETKAMLRFLKKHQPRYIASLHQPFGVVARTGKDTAWEKRLSKELKLPVKAVGVGTPSGRTSPTLTGWYNRYLPKRGTATTIELKRSVSGSYIRKRAAPGILRAARYR
ncbi:MAG: DUF2817 domain-containing protein [Aeromicrobium erythreum]